MSNRKNRGDGSIRKRSDGRWEGRYTAGRNEETGKLIYKVFWQGHKPSVSGSFGKRSGIGNIKQRR